MRVVAEISGDLRAILDQETDGVADAVRSGVSRASARTQEELRSQVRSAGLGQGLANAWRLQIYPTGKRSIHPAGLVYSKSTVLHLAFSEGTTITAHRARFLAIPTPIAVGMGFGRTGTSRKGGGIPGGQSRRAAQVREAISRLGEKNIRVFQSRRGRWLMMYQPPAPRGSRAKPKGIILFILVPQVRLAPRLDLHAAEVHAQNYLDSEVTAALGSE